MSLKNRSLTIFILGCMTALSPFSIDMYLPALGQIATEFETTVARVSLSLSAYFVGLACGQLFYGSLLDRFGRKRPLYVGIAIYIIATLCCLLSSSTEFLIAMRVLQAIGGCVAGVGAMAMVRDLFPPQEGAKVFSLLILILGVSPLLAPTIGGYLSTYFGWRSVFVTLAVMATALLAVVRFRLPESHTPDSSVSLRPVPILRDFFEILQDRRFNIYALSGAVAFSGLFVYLAGSSMIFMNGFGTTAEEYGWIFAVVASGMIIASQLNVVLLNRFTNRQLLFGAMTSQTCIAAVFFILSHFGLLNLAGAIFMFFLFMGSFGITNPNSMSIAMTPFSRNAGRASALMGFLQMSIGALASATVGILDLGTLTSIVAILATTSATGLFILLMSSTDSSQKA